MRRWTCLAWSVGLSMSLGVQAAEPLLPPSPQVFGEANQLQLVEFLAPPIPEGAVPPAPVDQLTPYDSEALPPMIASQAGTYSSPSTSPGMAAPAPAAAKPSAPKPPPQPWKPCFFDNDFSYKKTPHTHLFGEDFKDMPLDDILPWDTCEDTRFSVGGELRYRHMDERNRLRAPFGAGGRSTYDLYRWRQYFDLKHSDWVRVYIEMIDATITGNDLPVTGIDENHWDLQNAFVDLKILERDDKPVWLRVGRQELLFGAQRLVSPLDWSNIRRNFEGVRINSPGTTWDLDAWLVNPVNTATFGTAGGAGTPFVGVAVNDHSFDHAQKNILFGGAWATYKGVKDHTIDTFFLYDHHDALFVGGNGFPAAPPNSFPLGDRYTLATRWLGTYPADCGDRAYLTEIEGGYQFGNDKGQSVQAGYFTGGVGHTWKKVMWEPTIWGFYDWASGDDNPTDGVNGTFFQHYGLVHAYMGLIDNIARQNTSDVNYRIAVKPTKKLQLQVAHHFIQLDNRNDALYTVTGQKFGTPGVDNGSDVGQELDLLATWTYNQNFSIEVGQFWFWYGDYVTNVQPTRQDAQQFYVQTTFRY
ncbi:MAG: alginate export family protein [Planctomycetota bacterium]